MSAFCNLYAMQNAIMFNDAYDRNIIDFDSVVANFRYSLFSMERFYLCFLISVMLSVSRLKLPEPGSNDTLNARIPKTQDAFFPINCIRRLAQCRGGIGQNFCVLSGPMVFQAN